MNTGFSHFRELFFLFCIAIFLPTASYSQSDLLIFPKRLVFEGTKKRTQSLNLKNISSDTVTYRISHVDMIMDREGELAAIKDSVPAYSALSYFRVYPRTVTLAPGEAQLVKVQLVRTGELAKGEYRSHLYFRGVISDESKESNGTHSEREISVSISPVYGISIANILRIGDLSATTDITAMTLKSDKYDNPVLDFEIVRKGDCSTYGHIIVRHISEIGKQTTVATYKGVAVYTPEEVRRMKVMLSRSEGINYSEGKLEVLYSSEDQQDVYASSIFLLHN